MSRRKSGFGPIRSREVRTPRGADYSDWNRRWAAGGAIGLLVVAYLACLLYQIRQGPEGQVQATSTPGVCAEGSNFTDFYLDQDLPVVIEPGLRGLEQVRVTVGEEGVYVTDNLGTNFHPYVEGQRVVRIDNPWGRQEITAFEQANALGQEGVNVVSECIPAFSGSPESR